MEFKLQDFTGFDDWVRRLGGEVLAPTNEWEVIRFKSGSGAVHVAYRNKHGRISTDGFVGCALKAYLKKQPFDMLVKKTKRKGTYAREKVALLKRDGCRCFFCKYEMSDDEMTVEHIIALDKGGPNTLENMALCHEECNALADNLPIIEKIKLRDRMIGAVA